MTSPVNPSVDPMAPPVASPAPGASAMDEEIRQLAAALGVQRDTGLSGRKAVIDSVSLGDATTAPTVQVNLGGVLIPNIRIAASYSPVAGDTVLLLKQGNEFFAAFKIADTGSKSNEDAGGWVTASLDSSHAVNGSQTVMYRRINDHGSWKMQWKGTIDYGSGDTNLLASALDTEYRPSVARQCTVARSVTGGGNGTARVDFNTDGTVTFWGLSWSLDLGDSGFAGAVDHSHGGSTGFTDPADGLANSHAHSIPNTSIGSHSHDLGTASVTSPPWVALDGVEYFL